MKKVLFLLTFVVVLVCCTEKNVPDNGGNNPENPENPGTNPGKPGGGGEAAKLKVYLVDIQIIASESNHSKVVYTYNENDELKRREDYQNGVLSQYVDYTYSNNKRFGISHYADGTIMSYDTTFYNSLNLSERTSFYYPDWTSSKWQVNTWEYTGGKMTNHKFYSDGILTLNGDYTYSGSYRYGNTIGYQYNDGEYSQLDTLYSDIHDRAITSSSKTVQTTNGVSSESYYSSKTRYLDDTSDRTTSWEYKNYYHSQINGGEEYVSVTNTLYEYNWVNETTRYGVITTESSTNGNSSRSVSQDTAYFHLKK